MFKKYEEQFVARETSLAFFCSVLLKKVQCYGTFISLHFLKEDS